MPSVVPAVRSQQSGCAGCVGWERCYCLMCDRCAADRPHAYLPATVVLYDAKFPLGPACMHCRSSAVSARSFSIRDRAPESSIFSASAFTAPPFPSSSFICSLYSEKGLGAFADSPLLFSPDTLTLSEMDAWSMSSLAAFSASDLVESMRDTRSFSFSSIWLSSVSSAWKPCFINSRRLSPSTCTSFISCTSFSSTWSVSSIPCRSFQLSTSRNLSTSSSNVSTW
mmetsp:Transcript_27477/g.67831  ORF Transcript_27477/g.67831 Transcript_27477/m.67831 type:complete len:225 (-) Transcript_27477:167-841(-)